MYICAWRYVGVRHSSTAVVDWYFRFRDDICLITVADGPVVFWIIDEVYGNPLTDRKVNNGRILLLLFTRAASANTVTLIVSYIKYAQNERLLMTETVYQ
jgi:hypothetical protein